MFDPIVQYLQTAWRAAMRDMRDFGPHHRFYRSGK